MMRKGQTALEYLMTYGWAILIVIVVVAALYSLGLTKPCRWVGTQITGFSGGGFQVTGPKFTSDGTLKFNLKRIGATTARAINLTAKYGTTYQDATNDGFDLTTGDVQSDVTFTNLGSPVAGDCYVIDINITYYDQDAGRVYSATGKISGVVETA